MNSETLELILFLVDYLTRICTPKSMKQPQFGCSLEKWTSATFPPLSLYFQDFFSQQRSSRPNSRSCAMQSCCGMANLPTEVETRKFGCSGTTVKALSLPKLLHIFHLQDKEKWNLKKHFPLHSKLGVEQTWRKVCKNVRQMTKVLRAQQECLKVKIPAEQPFGLGAGEVKVLLRSSPMQNS